jgi:hypothetical protein
MSRRQLSVAAGVALVLALAPFVARSDDGRKPPEDPDAGFLEFLGSVDRLADVNPDYLSQADPAKATKPGDKSAQTPAPPPPPPPPRQALPPSASSASGVPKNE